MPTWAIPLGAVLSSPVYLEKMQNGSGTNAHAMQGDRLAAANMCDMLLRACGALGEVQLMLLTVRSMRALGIPVGYVAHGCVLAGLGRANKLEVHRWPSTDR